MAELQEKKVFRRVELPLSPYRNVVWVKASAEEPCAGSSLRWNDMIRIFHVISKDISLAVHRDQFCLWTEVCSRTCDDIESRQINVCLIANISKYLFYAWEGLIEQYLPKLHLKNSPVLGAVGAVFCY